MFDLGYFATKLTISIDWETGHIVPNWDREFRQRAPDKEKRIIKFNRFRRSDRVRAFIAGMRFIYVRKIQPRHEEERRKAERMLGKVW